MQATTAAEWMTSKLTLKNSTGKGTAILILKKMRKK
jgi:hypothetical protein